MRDFLQDGYGYFCRRCARMSPTVLVRVRLSGERMTIPAHGAPFDAEPVSEFGHRPGTARQPGPPPPGGRPSPWFGEWRLLAEGAPDDATADYLHRYFEPTARAIDGLETVLVGLGLLTTPSLWTCANPRTTSTRVWSTAFRASELAHAVGAEPDEYSDTCKAKDTAAEQDAT